MFKRAGQASMLRRLTRLRTRQSPPNEESGDKSGGSPEAGAHASSCDDACQMLVDMGFEREQAVQALQACGGDMSEAVVALVSAGAPALPPEDSGNRRSVAVSAGTPEGEGFSMEELDAVLNEALRVSEQEAEADKKRREEDRATLDAVLAASLECMGMGPSQHLTGLGPQPPVPPEDRNLLPPSPKEEQLPSPLIIHGLDDGELCEKVLRTSARKSHQNDSSLHVGLEAAKSPLLRSGKQLLPPLTPKNPRSLDAVAEEGQRRRHASKGQRKGQRQDEQPSIMVHNAPPPPTTAASSSQASEEIIALDDLEGWSRSEHPGARRDACPGMTSLGSTYPARILPVAPPRHGPGSQMNSPRSMANSSLRPPSRSQRNGLGNSGSNPFLAAAALSIS